MDEQLNKAIELLVTNVCRTGQNPKPDDALKMSQAVLNLAHARQLLVNGKK